MFIAWREKFLSSTIQRCLEHDPSSGHRVRFAVNGFKTQFLHNPAHIAPAAGDLLFLQMLINAHWTVTRLLLPKHGGDGTDKRFFGATPFCSGRKATRRSCSG